MKNRGFVAISVVLILITIVMVISSTITLLSIGEAQSGLSLFQGEDNLDLTEGCVADYLLKIRSNSSFSGGNVTRPEGTCTITISSGNPNWDMTVSSTQLNFQRKIRVTFTQTNKGLILTKWQEI